MYNLKDKWTDKCIEWVVLSSRDSSSTKEGNTGFFLQITESGGVTPRDEAPLFTPILRQLSPELTSVLRAGTFLNSAT